MSTPAKDKEREAFLKNFAVKVLDENLQYDEHAEHIYDTFIAPLVSNLEELCNDQDVPHALRIWANEALTAHRERLGIKEAP